MNLRIDVNDLIERRGVGRLQIELLVICGALLILDGFDTQAIGYVAPAIIRDWGVSRSELGPIFSSGLAGLMMGAFALGPLADRIGRKPTIILCAIVFGVFTLACSFVGTTSELMVCRFIAGLGLGGAMPNAIALTAEFSPERSRSRMTTTLVCGFSLGAAIGGFLASYIIPHLGWRSVFWIGGLIPLVLIPILFRLPESLHFMVLKEEARRTKIRAVVRRLAPGQEGDHGTSYWSSRNEGGHSSPRELFSDGRAFVTIMIWLGFFMNLIVLYFLSNYLPTILHGNGLSEAEAVQATAFYQVGGLIGALIVGWLMDRFPPRIVLAIVLACAALFIGLIGAAEAHVLMIELGTFGAGFCVVGGQIGANAYASSLYPTSVRSTGIGWALGMGRLGSVVGPMLVTGLLAVGLSIGTTFYAAALPVLLAALSFFFAGSIGRGRAQNSPVGSSSKLV